MSGTGSLAMSQLERQRQAHCILKWSNSTTLPFKFRLYWKIRN